MKIAIIGAGFFGTICGIRLSNKHEVHIYEKNKDILKGASLANQLRFHLGYHYPRSQKTVKEIKKHYKDFIKFFGQNIFGKTKNFYGISKEKSKVSFKKYLLFDDGSGYYQRYMPVLAQEYKLSRCAIE